MSVLQLNSEFHIMQEVQMETITHWRHMKNWRGREGTEEKQRIAFLPWISHMIFCIFLCHYIKCISFR